MGWKSVGVFCRPVIHLDLGHCRALQIKLDEIIRSHKGAKNDRIDLKPLTHTELEELQQRFSQIAYKARCVPSKKVTLARDNSRET